MGRPLDTTDLERRMRRREREWTRRKRQRRWGRWLCRVPILGPIVREYGLEQYEVGYRDGGADSQSP